MAYKEGTFMWAMGQAQSGKNVARPPFEDGSRRVLHMSNGTLYDDHTRWPWIDATHIFAKDWEIVP